MKIRLATIEDAPAISALLCSLSKAFIAQALSEEAADRLLGSMDTASIREYIASGYRYHVAEEGGEIVGAAAVKENRHLYHLFVSERYQGRGIARDLWEAAKAASLAAGNPGRLTVNSSLGAAGLYEKWGFVKMSDAVDKSGVVSVPMKWEPAAYEGFNPTPEKGVS